MQCKEWDDANSQLFKESHDEAVHKNSYKIRLYELISASLTSCIRDSQFFLRVALAPSKNVLCGTSSILLSPTNKEDTM